MSSGKWQPLSLGLNVLKRCLDSTAETFLASGVYWNARPVDPGMIVESRSLSYPRRFYPDVNGGTAFSLIYSRS